MTSRINAARKAVGDSGDEQRVIRTIPRREFQFVADVCELSGQGDPTELDAPGEDPRQAFAQASVALPLTPESHELEAPSTQRASVAVMPFGDRSPGGELLVGLANAIAHDVITRLAKLRSVFVIAQGTVFALHERNVGPEEAGRLLRVDYLVSGSIQRRSEVLAVDVELTETSSARIIWTESFRHRFDDTFGVLDAIGDRIVGSIAGEIEALERNRAVLRPPESLNAWQAYHRGLWHIYRFSKADNEQAQGFFEKAVKLDPTFSRAHAGLSFTHWQGAFQGWVKREEGMERAYATAGQSLMADDRDPAAHWAMGRALWLRGRPDHAIAELEQAVELSPNFALAHYNLAFVHATGGDPALAIAHSDHSRELSPYDPMLFAMLCSRALALARQGRFEDAVDWATKAAGRPNAHAHILAVAAYCLALADRHEAARVQLTAVRKLLPQYRVDDLVTAMQLDADGEALFRRAAGAIK